MNTVNAEATMRAALEEIARTAGTCGEWDAEKDGDCDRPAAFFEYGGHKADEFNRCCDRPACVESHAEEIRKAKSKGSTRGVPAPIVNEAARIAREALAKIGMARP